MLSSSKDSSLKIWDLREGRLLFTLQSHAGPVNAAEFSADGNFFASGGADELVMIWKSNLYGITAPTIDWGIGERPRAPATITSSAPSGDRIGSRDVMPAASRSTIAKTTTSRASVDSTAGGKSSRRNSPDPRRPSPNRPNSAPSTTIRKPSPAPTNTRMSQRSQASTPASSSGMADSGRKVSRPSIESTAEFKSSQDLNRSMISSIATPGLDESRSQAAVSAAAFSASSNVFGKLEEILGEVRTIKHFYYYYFLHELTSFISIYISVYSYNLLNKLFL